MKKCSVVIGSLWGDEGKGHMTDILCSSVTNVLNVRFNGGAQASHTVVTPKGERYAFRHIGAGTFAEADTYLSEDFIVNPILFVEEYRALWEKFELIPQVYINPNAIVTTFWDIFINQIVELSRGEKRHGSCGLGINETVVRSQEFKYKIFVSDLFDSRKLFPKLTKIREEYVPARLKYYGLELEQLDEEWKKRFDKEKSIELFLIFCDEFIKVAKIADNDIINDYDYVVFEGAQGLLLDQHSQFWPHVTRSNTGLKNVMKLLQNVKVKDKIDIYYMCRCYATKHGAGPFPGEFDVRTYANVVDETNISNEFQGSLRLGILDLDLLASAINKDLMSLKLSANVNICITCMDQIIEEVLYIINEDSKTSSKEEFISDFKHYMKEKLSLFNRLYSTNGLTRKDFSEV